MSAAVIFLLSVPGDSTDVLQAASAQIPPQRGGALNDLKDFQFGSYTWYIRSYEESKVETWIVNIK